MPVSIHVTANRCDTCNLTDYRPVAIPPPLFERPKRKSELADWLGCSERFLEEEITLGRLEARKLTVRLTVFLPRDVERWLESKKTAAKFEVVR